MPNLNKCMPSLTNTENKYRSCENQRFIGINTWSYIVRLNK